MLVEIAGAPVALRLLCVVLQELALETGQIVHQYNYYVPKSAQRRGSQKGGEGCSMVFLGIKCYFGCDDNGLVLMEGKHELTAAYVALLDQIRALLSRESLCNNTYLFKQMKHSLSLPLYIFAEERRIAAITGDEQQIAQAIQESGLARVGNNREVTIIEYPTVKISTKAPEIFHELQRLLKEKEILYSFSERLEPQWGNLTIYSQDIEFLEQLIVSLSRQVEFERASLYEDMRAGTTRIRKLKQEQKNNGIGFVGKTAYSLERPPQIFIRRAVPSDDEEERTRGRNSGNDRKKKYKQVTKQPANTPNFTNDDFPTLS